jgi:YggT family protein
MSIGSLLQLFLYAFLICLFVRGIFSFIEPFPRNRIHRVAFDITEPVVAPVRRLIPSLGGFDIAFTLVFIAVWILIGVIGAVRF